MCGEGLASAATHASSSVLVARKLQPLCTIRVCPRERPWSAVWVALLSWASLPVLHLVRHTVQAYLDWLRARMRYVCVRKLSLQSDRVLR